MPVLWRFGGGVVNAVAVLPFFALWFLFGWLLMGPLGLVLVAACIAGLLLLMAVTG